MWRPASLPQAENESSPAATSRIQDANIMMLVVTRPLAKHPKIPVARRSMRSQWKQLYIMVS